MINFNIQFWTGLISNFLISTILFIVCYSFFYIQNKNKKFSKIIKNKKWIYYAWLVFISISLSLITMISNIEMFNDNNIFLIANIFVFSLVFTPIIGFISIALVVIINLIFYFCNLISLFILLNTLLLLSLFLIFIFISWILIYKNNLLVFIYAVLITLLMNFNLLFADINAASTPIGLVIYNSSILMYILLIYSIAKPFTKFIINAKNINDSIYMKNNFILNKYFLNFFKNFREENNLQYCILFIIKFNFFEQITNEYGASIANKIKLKIINQTREIFSKDKSLYFLNKNNEYAFLVKIDDINNFEYSFQGNKLISRYDYDPLKKYEKYFKLLPTKLMIDNVSHKLDLKINTAFYGIQSNDIGELVYNCSQNYNDFDNKNILYLYDPNNIKNEQIVSFKNQILKQLNLFSNNDINIKFYDIEINKNKYTCFKPIIINKLIFNWNDIIANDYNEQVNDAIISHVSAKAAKQYDNHNELLVHYDMYSLSNKDFDVDYFVQKILHEFNIKYFAINLIVLKPIDNEYLVKNINKLLDKGINIFTHTNYEYFKNIFRLKKTTIKYKDNDLNVKENMLPQYQIVK